MSRQQYDNQRRQRRPNVLFITCHDLGRHLGCYGHRTIHSPSLDSLAASGVLLGNLFCTAPQCSPSRASLHTGRYPHSAGVMGLAHHPFGWRLDPSQRHIARILGEAGYSTALVGMQHLIDSGRAEELGYARVLPVAPAAEEAEAAVSLLREAAQAGQLRQPFYLEVGFEEPHRPYSSGGISPDRFLGVEVPPYLPDTPEVRADLAAFQGAVRVMDAAVGRILAELEILGLTAETWVLFAADHGIAMPRAKGTLYDPGLEVAALLRWPGGGVSGGRRIDALLSNVDVVPTILEGLGLPLSHNVQGRSFWPLLAGGDWEPRTAVYAEKTFHTYYEPMRCLRTASHKYIVNFEVSTAVDVPADVRESPAYTIMMPDFDRVRPYEELYDLASDPLEMHNVEGSQEYAATKVDLRSRLLKWMEETGDPLLDGPVASPYYGHAMSLLRPDGRG